MQLASLISDLTTLRACDSAAALALVKAGSGQHQGDPKIAAGLGADSKADLNGDEKDADMRRATDLLRLHQDVKVSFTPSKGASVNGTSQDPASTNQELQGARGNVSRALHSLGIDPGVQKLPAQSVLSSRADSTSAQIKEEAPNDEEDEDADLEAWS